MLELTKERDHLQEDVIGVEKAFDDLHRRFEKLKTKVEEFKKVFLSLSLTLSQFFYLIHRMKINYKNQMNYLNNKLKKKNKNIQH
jgi:uncharacterized coiled-coil protein SlyX